MNRRNFFKLGIVAVAGIALEEAIPFGRVWSFPSDIGRPKSFKVGGITVYQDEYVPPFAVGETMWWLDVPPSEWKSVPTPPYSQQVMLWGTNG